MPIRQKTIRRLAILAAVAAVLGGVAEMVIQHRHARREAWLNALRDQGMADYQAGDFSAAADELDRYITLHDADDDVVLAFALSKTRAGSSARDQELQSAQQRLQEILQHKPGNLAAEHALLELCLAGGDLAATERISDEILQRDPADASALAARVTIRLRQARNEDALAACRQRATARPDDLEARLAVMQLMMRLHKPPAELNACAADFKARRDSPALLLLRSIATDYAGQRDAAVALLSRAAAASIGESDIPVAVAGQIVNLFDAYKRFDEANAYLGSAVERGGSAELRRALAIRLWQQGQFARLPAQLPPRDGDDAAVIALNAAARFELHQSAAANPLLDSLRKRTDRLAAAWSMAVDARYDVGASPAEQAAGLVKALSRDPDNGIVRAWLGDCYDRAGETALAIRHWRLAVTQMPGWVATSMKLSQALLRNGRDVIAVQVAASAYDHQPNAATATNLATVRFAAQDDLPTDIADEHDLLHFVDELHDSPLLLPIRAGLLARTGQRDAAQDSVDSALKRPGTLDPQATLLLGRVIRQDGLAGSDTLLSGVAPDRSSPALLLERTLWLARAGRAEQAVAEWSAAVAAHAGGDAVDWRLAQCRYLDAVGSVRAAAAWQKLALDFPASPVVQDAVCSSAALQNEPQFVADAAERLRALTGDAGVNWRLQRARLLAGGIDSPSEPASVRDGVEAVTLLTDVVREAPSWIAPRIQLARTLAITGNPGTAIEHLRSAAAIDPSAVDVELELILLLSRQGRGDEVAAALRRFVPPARIDDGQRIALAASMSDAGLSDRAIALLDGSRHPLPSPGKLLLAELCRQNGRNDRAAAIYAELLAAPSPSPAALASGAEFAATRGQGDAARQLLQRLAASTAEPLEIAIASGRFEERFGSEAAALEQFKRAANTLSEAGAVALIDFHLRRGRGAEAVAAARQALDRTPGSRVLADRLIEATAASARVQRPGDLGPLIEALSHDPSRAGEVAALRSLSDLGRNKIPSQTLARTLRQISTDFPADLPLAQQAVSLCIRLADADGAVAVARRTLSALPNDPAALRLAVTALESGRRWAEMRVAAEQWQTRLGAPTIDTAAAIAEALLGDNNADAALAALGPFRATIAADARSQPQAAAVLARVLLSAGKTDQALAVAGQLFPDAAGRRSARAIARESAPTLASALSVYTAIKAATPGSARDEQSDLADLLAAIGRKFGDRATLSNAANAYAAYLNSVPGDTDAQLAMAGALQQLGEFGPAETHLRGLLDLSPGNTAAKNDLACVLLAQDKALDEAERLARAAVSAAPATANYHDTLARVLAATGRPADARASFQTALRLDANLVPARVSLAKLMRDQGDMTAARTELRRVDGTLQADPRAGDFVEGELSVLRAELTQLDQ